MKRRITRLIPGHGRNFAIGDVVEAEPCQYVAKCYNIAKTVSPAVTLRVQTVPADHLEEIKS